MKLLLTALVLCLLVVIYHFFGLMWGLGIVVGVILAALFVPPILKKMGGSTTTTGATATSARKGFGLLSLAIAAILAALLTLGIIWFLSKEKTNPEVTVVTTPLGCREIQLVETWEFIWWSTDGGYYRGQKSGGPYEVRIMQNTSEALWFDVFYQYDGKLQKASFELTWDGRQYAGVWSQASPKDSGDIYLRRVNGAWSGHYTNRDNVSFDCALQMVMKKK